METDFKVKQKITTLWDNFYLDSWCADFLDRFRNGILDVILSRLSRSVVMLDAKDHTIFPAEPGLAYLLNQSCLSELEQPCFNLNQINSSLSKQNNLE